MSKRISFKYNKEDDGWKLIESANPKGRLVFKEYLRKKESYIKGDELIRRVKAMGHPAGQYHAEQMLNQSIPEKLREFALLFTGTIWAHPDGYQCIPALRIGKLFDIEHLAGFGVPVIEGFHNYGWIIDFVRLDKGLLNPALVAVIEK